MCTVCRVGVFAFVYVAIFIAAMGMITNGVIDVAACASAPVILSAEALVLGMIYMTTFHGEVETSSQPASISKLAANENFAPRHEKSFK